MKCRFLIVLFAATCLLLSSFPHSSSVVRARSFRYVWFDSFDRPAVYDDFSGVLKDRWQIYRGHPLVVQAAGRPSVLSLTHPEPGGELDAFRSPFGSSLFLWNPSTVDFADGMIEFDLYFETSGWAGVSALVTFRMQSDDAYYALRLTSTRDWRSSFVVYSRYGGWREIGVPSEIGVFPTGAWCHVAVTIGGSRMSCYRDGILICYADDSTWSKGCWGGIGLQNNYYGGAFYVDDFRISGRMKWVAYRGSPRIDTGFGRSGASLLFDHPGIWGDEASFGHPESCSAFISDPDLREFESGIIEFDMYFDNDVGQKAFVTFRMLDEHNYYAAKLTSTFDWNGYFLRRIGADSWYMIGSKSYYWAIAPKVWFHVTIVIDGAHFELWRDWELLFSGDDWSIPRGKWGGIGFYSAYYGCTFHIDNLKICIQA